MDKVEIINPMDIVSGKFVNDSKKHLQTTLPTYHKDYPLSDLDIEVLVNNHKYEFNDYFKKIILKIISEAQKSDIELSDEIKQCYEILNKGDIKND